MLSPKATTGKRKSSALATSMTGLSIKKLKKGLATISPVIKKK